VISHPSDEDLSLGTPASGQWSEKREQWPELGGGRKEREMGIAKGAREQIRQRMEDALPGYRLGRAAAGEMTSWVRAVRQAVGMPAEEFARRMGVQEREVYRMERAEAKSRIELGSLRRAAEALDCELIYALTPRKGTLGEMAAANWTEREKVIDMRRTKRDDQREIEGKPRRRQDPQMVALKELIRMAGL
jgi:predicted DNA-binding mobile mystery protein A